MLSPNNDFEYFIFLKAGETFVTISLHQTKLGNKHDAATNYVDAANCFKKSDPKG
jgi:alpha-soluble NSF attachment protein